MLACKYRTCQDKVEGNLEVPGGAVTDAWRWRGAQEGRPASEGGPIAIDLHMRRSGKRAQHAAPLQRNFRSVTLCCVVAEAVGQPGHGCEHAEPADRADDAADFLVLGEEAPLGEENFPVGVAGAD